METKEGQKKGFSLGRLVATPNALGSVVRLDLVRGVERHASGDWGASTRSIGR